ncbi:MAG: hypothetical protein KatS3mg101_0907 [Patescibacteria group bacterium]|nr:MAG: hypothetical protein KatS3mg101_0907 [Patescibacteria group bacterium]
MWFDFKTRLTRIDDKSNMINFDLFYETYKRVPRWGQAKLLFFEIQFLTHHWSSKHKNPTLLYIGAASGEHIVILSQLFPSIKFELYDNREFDKRLYSRDNVTIHNKLFEEEDLEYWKGKELYLISDIRTVDYLDKEGVTKEDLINNDEIIIKDMELQRHWYEVLKPIAASLKFRLPYFFHNELSYLDGKLIVQPWAPRNTTECRLIPNGKTKTWNIREHVNKMAYLNTIVRKEFRFYNFIDGNSKKPFSVKHGLNNDFDSAYTVLIALNYLKKMSMYNSNTTLINFLGSLLLKINDIPLPYIRVNIKLKYNDKGDNNTDDNKKV